MAQAAPSLRLVLDTNVVVAGLLWSGPPRRLIESAIEGVTVELFSSPVLLDELAHTLGYAKFNARITRSGSSVPALLAQYTALVTLRFRQVCRAWSPTMPMTITSSPPPSRHAHSSSSPAIASICCPSVRIRASPSSPRVRSSNASTR